MSTRSEQEHQQRMAEAERRHQAAMAAAQGRNEARHEQAGHGQ